MKDFTEKFGFIVAFLAATIVSQMTLGNKFTNNFLVLIIISAILINSDKFIKLLNGVNAK
jgi:hypothetical protein